MGLMLAEPDFHTRCFVEWEEYPRSTIIAAQRAGYFAPAPIWDDLTTFDAKPFAGAIDTLLAGYPCQPFSQAGKRLGADDPRHLWPHVARIIRELGDGLRWVFLENVAGHITLGAETVLRELWDMGWAPAAGAFSAAETGAPHERLRWFCVAHRDTDADAGWVDGRPNFRSEVESEDQSEEREWVRPWPGSGCGNVAHRASAGRAQRGSTRRAEAGAESGNRMVAEPQRFGGNGNMADTSQPGPQRGEQPRSPDQWDRAPASGSAAECGCLPLFPPGPGDRGAWADTLAVAPYLAPAAGLADCLAWARNLAAAVAQPEQAAAQSALCRMADGLALRSRALRLLGNGVHPLAAANAWRALSAAHGLGAVDLEAAGRDAGGDADGDGVVT